MENQIKKAPLLTPVLRTFLMTMILANVAANMYSNILPLYLKSLNASVIQIGLFFTISQIIPLVLQILGGWISDRLGRLKSIAIGSVAGVLSYVGFILAPTWQWVLSGQTLISITQSLIGPSFGAFIAEESAEENRARVYGITSTIFMIVTVIGPPFGGFLVDKYGFKFMLLCAGLIYTVATVMRVLMAKRAASHEKATSAGSLNFRSLKANMGAMAGILIAGGLITWVLVTDGIRDISFSLSGSLLPIYMQDFGALTATQIGWLSSIFGVANMLITIPAGWLADKKGERLAIILGFLIQAGTLFLLTNVNSFIGYVIVWALFGIGVGVMSPAYQSLLSKALPQKLRGTGFGLIQSSLGVFSLPAPAIGASLYQNVSPKAPFLITAGASLLSIIPVWLKFKISKKDEDTNSKALEILENAEASEIPA